MSAWPATLADLKLDIGITDTDSDAQMQLDLDAAIAYVERVLADVWNFDGTKPWLPAPIGADAYLGTLRIAGRTIYRRRSPDGMVGAADGLAIRVPSTDADIERLLQTNRYSGPMFA